MSFFKRVFDRIFNRDFMIRLDQIDLKNNPIRVKGWVFNKKHKYDMVNICFELDSGVKKIPIELYERPDVYKIFGNANAKDSGFDVTVSIPGSAKVYIEGVFGNSRDVRVLGNVASDCYDCFIASSTVTSLTIPPAIYNHKVDVIIPVYNGFDYLENLLRTVQRTKIDYRLIIINDKSPDERVLPYLDNFAESTKNVVLINNQENLGFVRSVNKGLSLSDNHVAIVNSDIILPELWLERLMAPIIMKNNVASSTPFTNSGTICSFPNFCEDNDIFLDLDVDSIDSVFSLIKPVYTELPTGVGFCMGMNKNVLKKIGVFDEAFYKGYGEENDWCQKAIIGGYKNVMVENLFVYHKHGGSFQSEDKQEYLAKNSALINARYPSYVYDVQEYCAKDPVKAIREYVKWQLIFKQSAKNIVMFDHNWGGGANNYSEDYIKSAVKDDYGVFRIVSDVNSGIFAEYSYKNDKSTFSFNALGDCNTILDELSVEKIIINELVSFKDLYSVLDYIIALKQTTGAKLVALVHDFYSVCPSLYLIDDRNEHCFKSQTENCERCIANNKNVYYSKFETITAWRKNWYDFLEKCDEITAFSNNTTEYLAHYYPELKNITVVPHKVNYIRNFQINIGLLGNFMYTKGSEMVFEMLEIVRKNSLPVNFIVVGENLEGKSDKNLTILGKYKREDLPSIINKHAIDIVFISSIWPETFSYTTEEAIQMEIPVASFNLGAQSERISKYDKGLVISKIDAQTALTEIIAFVKSSMSEE